MLCFLLLLLKNMNSYVRNTALRKVIIGHVYGTPFLSIVFNFCV